MIRTTSSRLAAQGLNILRAATSTSPSSVTESLRYQGTAATESSSETDKNLVYSEEEGYYKTSPFEPVAYQNVTLDKYVWKNVKKWEKKIATVDVVTGRQYNFAQLRDCTAALAIRLQSIFKLKPRDVIAICLPNLPEYPIAALGAIEAGLAVTTVNPIYTADEIARQLILSDTKLIFGTVKVYSTLQKACAIAKKNIRIIAIRTKIEDTLPEGAVDFYELINTANVDFSSLQETDITADDTVFIPFSSGTTGLPKGVMLSHKNIVVNCDQMKTKSPVATQMLETTATQQDVVPSVLPFFHIYGLTVVMLSKIELGIKLVTLPKFTPEYLIKALHEYEGTALNVVPPIALFLTHSNKVTTKHASKLRLVMSGAAPIGQADVERFLKKFPQVAYSQGYGMTEASPTILITPVGLKKYTSAGILLGSTEAKIIALDNSDGKGVGPNIAGELYIRGPQVMKGYLNNAEATEDIFHDSPSGRWMCTGDVAYYDETGLFFITDRMKELIKVKGFQVPPAELEECLRGHPKILDAAVIGIPHEQHGEVPKGIVVLKPKVTATEEEIKAYVAEKVAEYKQLEGGVVFVRDIPKNPTGKILRKDLKAKYC